MRLPFSWSAGPVKALRQLPPYLPISCSGFTTKSCEGSGRRLSTAGSFPAFTCSASIGASLKVFGKALASRMISGPSSFPISDEPIFGRRIRRRRRLRDRRPRPHRKRCRGVQDPPAHVPRASISYESPFSLFRSAWPESRRLESDPAARCRRPPPTPRRQGARNHPPVWPFSRRRLWMKLAADQGGLWWN